MSRYHRHSGPIQGLADALGMSGVSGQTGRHGPGRHALRLVGLIVVVGVAVGTWAGVKAAARIEPTILVQTLANPDETAGPGLSVASPILTSAAILEVKSEAVSQPIVIPDLRPEVLEPPARLVSVRFEEEFPEAFDPNQSVVVDVVTAPATGPASVPVDAPALFTPVLPIHVLPVMTKARIAIIIDDLGLHEGRARQIADLPAVLTLSWLPYAEHIRDQTQYGFERGHQIFAHVPMQPGGDEDPGPNALMTWHGKTEIKSLLDVQLSEFTGLTGINNHMGSRFTQNAMSMSWLMAEVKARDLLFVDSLTSPRSEGATVAQAYGLPFLKRDFFIDHDAKGNAALVEQRLAQLEALALERGEVIAIGHPYEVTIAGLEAWIPAARARGVEFITVSRLTAAQTHPEVMQVARQQ